MKTKNHCFENTPGKKVEASMKEYKINLVISFSIILLLLIVNCISPPWSLNYEVGCYVSPNFNYEQSKLWSQLVKLKFTYLSYYYMTKCLFFFYHYVILIWKLRLNMMK